MTKKRSSEIFAAKMEIFSEKIVILVGEKFLRPPKLGARFPPMVTDADRQTHIHAYTHASFRQTYKHADIYIHSLHKIIRTYTDTNRQTESGVCDSNR